MPFIGVLLQLIPLQGRLIIISYNHNVDSNDNKNTTNTISFSHDNEKWLKKTTTLLIVLMTGIISFISIILRTH